MEIGLPICVLCHLAKSSERNTCPSSAICSILMCRLVLHPSGAWLCASARSRSCQDVCHGFMPRPSRLDRWLLRCGALGVLSQHLRACSKSIARREGGRRPEWRARQRADESAVAGPRSPAPRTAGGASGTRACRAHKLRCSGGCGASYVGPPRVSTLFCLFSLPLGLGSLRRRTVPHRTLGDCRRLVRLSTC